MNRDYIEQNLKDAGCNTITIDKILLLIDSGKEDIAMKLLASHKLELLTSLHENQKKIDCLDFLIFNLKQRN